MTSLFESGANCIVCNVAVFIRMCDRTPHSDNNIILLNISRRGHKIYYKKLINVSSIDPRSAVSVSKLITYIQFPLLCLHIYEGSKCQHLHKMYNAEPTFSYVNPLKPNILKQRLLVENITHCYDWTIITILNLNLKKNVFEKWFLGLANFFASGLQRGQ